MLRGRGLNVVIRIAEIQDGKPKRVYSIAWGQRPSKRHFVLLINGGSVAYPVANG